MSRRSRSRSRPTAAPPGTSPTGSPDEHPLDRIPRWVPPVVFAVATLLLFREFVFSDEMLVGTDTLALGYMARAFFADALSAGSFPLWNPVILGGTPFLESLAGGDSLYPPSLLLLLVMETYRSLGWKLVLHVFLAGLFMYGWLRALGISRGGSMVGGLGFLLAPYMVTLVFPGHDGKLFVTALTPLVFWMTELSLRRPSPLLPLAGLGGAVALVILTTHFQMAYFLFGGVGAYALFRTVERAREGGGWPPPLRRFGLFLLFSVIGAGAAGVQLLPAFDYVTSDSRRAATTVEADAAEARAYSSSWSLHPEEIASLAVPEFVGSSVGGAEWTSETYWGRNPFKLNHEYLGIVLLLLGAISFLGAPGRGTRWFLTGMGAVVLLFTLGAHTPVWRIFYEVVPGISLFRAPSMAIFLPGFALATLAAFGVDRGVRMARSEEERTRLHRLLLGGMGVLALGWLLAMSGVLWSLWFGVFDPGLTEAKADAFRRAGPFITRGFFLALLLAGALAATWWGYARSALPAGALVALLGLLVAVDQIRVNDPFLGTMDYFQWSQPDGNVRFLLERQREELPFRVFSMMDNQGQDVTPGMHGLELAGGHHPNDLLRYREVIGMEGSGVPMNLATFNPNVLRILNVRYILWPVSTLSEIEGAIPLQELTFADGRVYSAIYRYPDLPRARVVGSAQVVSEVESLELVLDPERFDPATETVLVEAPPIPPGGREVRGQARWLERTPNRLRLSVESTGPAILVLSENWSPGWSARVDGVETPVLRADHTLRGVALPGGTHEVELTFRGPRLRAGLTLTLLSSLLLLGTAVGGVLRDRTGRERADSTG